MKNYLETVHQSSSETKKLWHRIFAAVAIFEAVMWGLMLFPPLFGITLFLFSFGFMTLGIKSYTINLLNGTHHKIEYVFSKWRRALSAFCLLVVKTAYSLLWSLCFVVPGIIACLNYSFAFYVMSEDDQIDAFSALEKSKKLVYGFRAKMLFLFILYTLLFVASLCLGGGAFLLFIRHTAIHFKLALLIGFAISAVVMTTLVLPFMHITYANVYLEAKAANAEPPKKIKRNSVKKKKPEELL